MKVGDDVWIRDVNAIALGEVQLPAPGFSSRAFSVHQVTSIDATRRTVAVDFPINTLHFSYETPVPHLDVVFTDRRVPFQSRSVSWAGLITLLNKNEYQVDGVTHSSTLWNSPTNAQLGDELYWVINGHLQSQKFIVDSVTGNNVGYTGNLPIPILANLYTAATTGVFIHKTAAHLARWQIDAENMKMAPTTFSYEGHTYDDPRTTTRSYIVNNTRYGSRYHQNFDGAALSRQVKNAAKAAAEQGLFDNTGSGNGSANTLEKVSQELLQTVPATAEIASSVGLIDFGNNNVIEDGTTASTIIRPYGSGTVRVERLPSPFFGIRAYQSQTAIMNFVKNDVNDKPLLQLVSGTGNLTLRADAHIGSSQSHAVSPLCVGVQTRPTSGGDDFIIWTSTVSLDNKHPIDAVHLGNQMGSAVQANISVSYDSISRQFKLGRKESAGAALVAGQEMRLFGHDGDFIASTLSSQVDLVFPWRQLILTSADLQQVPERTQDAASRQPILSSYTLPTMIPTSINAEGKPAGGTSQAFGTIYFSESGARRYHHLIQVPGALRYFRIQASITRKDPTVPETKVQLAPGGAVHLSASLYAENG